MARPSVLDKVRKNSTIEDAAQPKDSKIFGAVNKNVVRTHIPMVNVALSGKVDGGLQSGMMMIGGKSRSFKSNFALLMAASFLKENPDGLLILYDNEFGSPEEYFQGFDINLDNVWHVPILDIEELKHDLVTQLAGAVDSKGKVVSEGLKRGDKVLIIVDSIGMLASRKEIEDAQKGSSAADMTRAKALKSLARMVTPHLTMKDIPMVVINHVYDDTSGNSRSPILGGGSGMVYACNTIWVIGKEQETEGEGVKKQFLGSTFVVNIEKSRFIKDKVKFRIKVLFGKGMYRWSGLFDEAVSGGYITQSGAWCSRVDPKTGEVLNDGKKFYRKDVEHVGDFWKEMFKTTDFAEFIQNKYKLDNGVTLDMSEDVDFEDFDEDADVSDIVRSL